MAKATATTNLVHKMVAVKELQVVLTLSEDEAKTLRAVLGSVQGSNQRSPRKHANSVYAALSGALNTSLLQDKETMLLSGTLNFRDYNEL